MDILILVISSLLIILFLIQDIKTEGILSSNQVYKNVKERGIEKGLFIFNGILVLAYLVVTFMGGL